jgi:hypothetical protein
MTQPGYIFIVGCFRSGTTLMRRILDSSEDVAICGETHFLGALAQGGLRHQLAQVGDMSTDAGVEKVVDYIYHNIHGPGFLPSWVQKNIDRGQFLRRLLETDRTDRALFDLIMASYARGKPIRGEKTPAHIHHVPTLLKWFPEARIVHMLRDPRAIFVSERKKADKQKYVGLRRRIARKSALILDMYLSLSVLIQWLRIIQLHYRYQRLYPHNYYFVRFEDLISDPKSCLKELCDFLEIDLTQAMLQQKVVNSSFVSRDEHIPGFDISAIDRWRQHLHPVRNKWFVFWCKRYLLEFGYQL